MPFGKTLKNYAEHLTSSYLTSNINISKKDRRQTYNINASMSKHVKYPSLLLRTFEFNWRHNYWSLFIMTEIRSHLPGHQWCPSFELSKYFLLLRTYHKIKNIVRSMRFSDEQQSKNYEFYLCIWKSSKTVQLLEKFSLPFIRYIYLKLSG